MNMKQLIQDRIARFEHSRLELELAIEEITETMRARESAQTRSGRSARWSPATPGTRVQLSSNPAA